ncbi:MAG TPA: FtsX-like permease family protein, partial [Candidatus Sulfotelmatobacter sp.]|nr:FtsX-like permease family protein [Candidatus Sulfotelmatobacter sp.]
GLDMVVRTNTAPDMLASAINNVIHETDPDQAVLHVMTMEQFLANALTPQRFNMLMLATFAGVALAMAAMGIYSVLSYMVRRRVREIGIRMALGAQIRDVLRLIVVEGMKPVIAGVMIGATATLLLGRVVAKLIYGVKPSDPATFIAVSALLATVALLATAVPAYRATKVDPMRTLRDE